MATKEAVIANLLELRRECQPKVLVVNVLFRRRKSGGPDFLSSACRTASPSAGTGPLWLGRDPHNFESRTGTNLRRTVAKLAAQGVSEECAALLADKSTQRASFAN